MTVLLLFRGFPHTDTYSNEVISVAKGEVVRVQDEAALKLFDDFPGVFVEVSDAGDVLGDDPEQVAALTAAVKGLEADLAEATATIEAGSEVIEAAATKLEEAVQTLAALHAEFEAEARAHQTAQKSAARRHKSEVRNLKAQLKAALERPETVDAAPGG